jgi:hypothetical protein
MAHIEDRQAGSSGTGRQSVEENTRNKGVTIVNPDVKSVPSRPTQPATPQVPATTKVPATTQVPPAAAEAQATTSTTD